MKNTIIAGVLLLIATFFVTVGVAEISFPETFLTFTDQDWLLNIWPKAYRYNIHVGIGAVVIACALIVPAIKIQKDFAIRALETLCRFHLFNSAGAGAAPCGLPPAVLCRAEWYPPGRQRRSRRD